MGRPNDPVPAGWVAGLIDQCRFRTRPTCQTCTSMLCESQTRQGSNKIVYMQDCIQCIVQGGPPER